MLFATPHSMDAESGGANSPCLQATRTLKTIGIIFFGPLLGLEMTDPIGIGVATPEACNIGQACRAVMSASHEDAIELLHDGADDRLSRNVLGMRKPFPQASFTHCRF